MKHAEQIPYYAPDGTSLGFRYRHEPIYYGWTPGAPHNAVPTRDQDTVWECPRPKRSLEHPTMKPVDLVERALRNSSRQGDMILDAFGGSGTTIIACERTGRHARLSAGDLPLKSYMPAGHFG